MASAQTGGRFRMSAPLLEETMHGEPISYSKPKVERKVTAATAGSYLSLLAVLTVLQAISADLDLIAWLPD